MCAGGCVTYIPLRTHDPRMGLQMVAIPALTDADRLRLGRRVPTAGRSLDHYNVVEAIIAIRAGPVAGSVALVGFGLDS